MTTRGADLVSRLLQIAAGVILGVISAALLITIHRATVELGGVPVPTGLLLGAVFQLAASLFLLNAFASRLPVLILVVTWGAVATILSLEGPGGGVLVPAQIGDRMQYAGWIVQGIGVGIPLLVLLVDWTGRMRRITAEREAAATGDREMSAPRDTAPERR
ncbi:MAG: hypothetical protein Q4G40_06995 [Brachybacterium sp.]|nr:hypothetical protein [Brachybacterium sp.]